MHANDYLKLSEDDTVDAARKLEPLRLALARNLARALVADPNAAKKIRAA